MPVSNINLSFPIPQPSVNTTRSSVVSYVANSDVDGNLEIVITAKADMGATPAVRQVDSLVINTVTNGNVYCVDITAGGLAEPEATVLADSNDTVETVAVSLANLIQRVSDKVSASADAGTITLTGNNPGEIIIYSLARSTTPVDMTLSSTTVASGASNMIELGTYTVTCMGGESVSFKRKIEWKNGNTILQTVGPQTVSHRLKMSEIYNEANS
jgi:hypothetical protein